MAPRIARPYLFRARSSVVSWATVFRAQLAGVPVEALYSQPAPVYTTHVAGPGGSGALREDIAKQAAALADRPADVQLRWMVKQELGAPFAPFTVWVRRAADKPRPTDVVHSTLLGSPGFWLPDVAATVLVDCEPLDRSRAVALSGTYCGGGLVESVGMTAVAAPASGRVTLTLRTSGAQFFSLTNATDPKVQAVWLQDAIDSPDWKPLEIVGLPADSWPGTAYDTGKQGMVAALTSPEAAALERLQRGGPPTGYAPLTSTGRLVDPPWRAPDPGALVKEVLDTLLPHVERIYRPALTPADQAALLDAPPVDPPSVGSTTSDIATSATLSPLALLLLPASADPFLALATGYGTAYPATTFVGREAASKGRIEFLVTADYPDTPERSGPVQMCAYLPDPRQHVATPAPNHVTTRRAGLLAPEHRDEAWRESVHVQWDRLQPTAGMSAPTSAVVARFEAGAPTASVLQPERDAGDRRALVLVPDGVEGTPAFGRCSMTDGDQPIPLGSGGRHVGYPVAVQDVFGVWSPWTDVTWDGTEPAPPGPHVVSASLTSTYAGSSTCPATLTTEITVEWDTRTPTSLELHTVFFPAATSHQPPPAGTSPTSAPTGTFTRNLSLAFVGDVLTGPADVTIVHLDDTGTDAVTPGPLQGDHGRRYRLTVPVPTLDFAATPRWGVQLWALTPLAVVADAGWQPPLAPPPPQTPHPALAYAASPVPVPADLPLPLPGVPMGSTPDDRNRSHARIWWNVPAGASLDATGGCVVWECSETALRTRAHLSPRAAAGTVPGARLAELWDAYDGLSQDERRSAFRRLLTLPGTARDADVALPPGTTDIHLFTVTTQSATHVDSDWPLPGDPSHQPHVVLQAVAAPRLHRPAAPEVRAVLGAGGTVVVSLSAGSDVPVQRFELYRTRSPEAAMRVETMGPSFASVTAVGSGPADPQTGLVLHTGSWTGGFDPSWDDWLVRAVAVPVPTVDEAAVRGLPSLASDQVTVRVRPTTPPDLAPLTADLWGGGHDGVVVVTSTSAPARDLADGVFRLSAHVSAAQPSGAAADVPATALGAVVVGPTGVGDPAPAEATADVVVRAGTRTAGRIPLALWFTRPVAADPVDVSVRLVDPRGASTTQTVTVPGWVPAAPPTLTIEDVTTIVGRFVAVRLSSDAPVDPGQPVTMTVVVTSRGTLFPMTLPVDRGLSGVLREPVALTRVPPLVGRTKRTTFSSRLDQLPTRGILSTDPIQVVRSGDQEYSLAIRIAPPFTFTVSLDTDDGRHAQVQRTVS